MIGGVARRKTHPDLIKNQLAVYFARNSESGDFQRVTTANDAASQAQPWGVKRETYDAEWIRETATAAALAARMVADLAWPSSLIDIEGSPLDLARLELSDGARVSDDCAGLFGSPCRITGLSFPEPDMVKMTMASSERVIVVWSYDANNYIHLHLGSMRLRFVLGGALAAIIDGSGVLMLKGDIQEKYRGGSDVTQAGPVAWNAARSSMSFGVYDEAGSAIVRVSELLPSGTLEVGGFTENPLFPLAESGATTNWIHANLSVRKTYFSGDKLRTFMRLERFTKNSLTQAKLIVKGIKTHAF
jgi:hypothetical protein